MYDKFKFLSGSLYSMISQIHIPLPTLTLISKIDLMKSYGESVFSLEQYLQTENVS